MEVKDHFLLLWKVMKQVHSDHPYSTQQGFPHHLWTQTFLALQLLVFDLGDVKGFEPQIHKPLSIRD